MIVRDYDNDFILGQVYRVFSENSEGLEVSREYEVGRAARWEGLDQYRYVRYVTGGRDGTINIFCANYGYKDGVRIDIPPAD